MILLHTKFGDIYLQAGDARHVYLTTCPDDHIAKIWTVRGIDCRVSAHYSLHEKDKQWYCGPEFNSRGQELAIWERKHYLHAYRIVYTDFNKRSLSNNADDKIRAELDRVVNEWACKNWTILQAAELEELARQNAKLAEQIEEKKKEIAALEAQMRAVDVEFVMVREMLSHPIPTTSETAV